MNNVRNATDKVVYFRPKDIPLPDALRTITELTADTFVGRLQEIERFFEDAELTDDVIIAMTDDEVQLILTNRSLFPWPSELIVGLDNMSLWWTNAASMYGSKPYAALQLEDAERARTQQRKEDLLGDSAIRERVPAASLAAETAHRRATRLTHAKASADLGVKLEGAELGAFKAAGAGAEEQGDEDED